MAVRPSLGASDAEIGRTAVRPYADFRNRSAPAANAAGADLP
jgi:hypothetical protein